MVSTEIIDREFIDLVFDGLDDGDEITPIRVVAPRDELRTGEFPLEVLEALRAQCLKK